jgi:integrase
VLYRTCLRGRGKTDIFTGIDGFKWISCKRQKTDSASNIPLLPLAEAIVNKYSNDPVCMEKGLVLPVRSNQKMNKYLKEIADLFEIKIPLTFHIARHTFATTVTLSNRVPIETVSKLLAHQKIATAKEYAQVLDHKISDDMNTLREKFVGKF